MLHTVRKSLKENNQLIYLNTIPVLAHCLSCSQASVGAMFFTERDEIRIGSTMCRHDALYLHALGEHPELHRAGVRGRAE